MRFGLFLFFCALLLVGYYWPVLATGQTLYYRDNTLFFEPLCRFIGTSIAQARIDLWNPFSYCGMPQAAIPSPGLFYPPNLLFGYFSYSSAVALQMILHQGVLAAGSYALARSYGLTPASAALSGLTLGLCGYNFSLESNYTMVASVAWAPLAFLALRKIESGSFLWCVIASVSTFLIVTAGRPEMVAPALALLGAKPALELWHYSRAKTKGQLQKIFIQFAAIFVGILLAAPCIMPALEWLLLSRRSSGLSEAEVFLFSASWYDLIGILAPQPLGDLCLRGAPFLSLVTDGRMAPYVPSSFIGPFAIAFALIAAFDRSFKYRWHCIAIGLATAIFCLGSNTPLGPLLLSLCPALSLLRFPSKFLIFLVGILAVMAAYGLHCVCTSEEKLAFKPLLILWSALLGATALLLLPGSEQIFAASVAPELKQAGAHALAISLAGSALAGLVTTLLSLFVNRKKIAPVIFAPLICVAAGLSMVCFAAQTQRHFGPAGYFDQPSFVADKIAAVRKATAPKITPHVFAADSKSAQMQRTSTLFFEVFTCPPKLQQNDAAANTIAWYAYARQMLYPATNIDSQMLSTFGYESSMKGDYFKAFTEAYFSSSQCRAPQAAASDLTLFNLLQTTACDTVVTQMYRFASRGAVEQIKPLNSKYFKLVAEDIDSNFRLYQLDTLPRIFLTDSWLWQAADSAPELTDSADEQICFLETTKITTPALIAGALPQPTAGSQGAKLVVQHAAADKITLSATCSSGVMLILNDQYYPGWLAKVDGRPVQIYQANKFFRAVYVPAGQHQIDFAYEPESLKKGLLLALTGVCILVGFGIYGLASTRADRFKQK